MNFKEHIMNESQKQHLNLSDYAWDVIEKDRKLFAPGTNVYSLSGFLNQVFLSWYYHSPLNLETSLKNAQSQLREIFSQVELSSDDESILMKHLVEAHLKNESKKYLSFPKGASRKIYLNNATLQLLSSIGEDSIEARIYKRPGKLLKAVFETYCRLPYIEREKIMFSSTMNQIQRSISLHYPITVLLQNDAEYEVIPYKIIPDIQSNYNYLVGLSRELSSSLPTYASFRLSRIKHVDFNFHEDVTLSSEQIKELDQLITERGVQFLLQDTVYAVIRLTNKGKEMYNSHLHLRPQYIRKEENDIYIFSATNYQIMAYFFKFGSEAEIIEPIDLRNEFMKKYRDAYFQYPSELKV